MYVASNGIKTAVILQDTEPENPRDPGYQENLGTMVCWHRRYKLGDKHEFEDPSDFALALAKNNTSWPELLQYIKDNHSEGLRLQQEGEGYQLQFKTFNFNDVRENWDSFDVKIPADFSHFQPELEMEDVLSEMVTSELINLCKDKVAILPLYLYDHSGITMSTSDFGDRWDSGCVGFIYMEKDTAMKELGMAGDEVRIAQALDGRRADPIKLTRKSPRDSAHDALIAQGFQPVKGIEDITNLNGPAVARYPGLRETVEHAMQSGGGLYKKDHTLYTFVGYNEDLTFNVRPVATFNPNILRVNEDTWRSRAIKCLHAEVEQYDAYLRNDVYGMKFYEGTSEIESVWGFYETKDQDIRKEIFVDELGDWCDDLIDKMAGAAYEPEPDGDFDIDDFFAEHDFPELREQIRQAVCEFIKSEAGTYEVYPFDLSPEDILDNKTVDGHLGGALDAIVDGLYEEHLTPTKDLIYDAILEYAGPSREVQPKLSVADLDPSKDYTESELLAILKKKPSLSDQIAGAHARQASQNDSNPRPGREPER